MLMGARGARRERGERGAGGRMGKLGLLRRGGTRRRSRGTRGGVMGFGLVWEGKRARARMEIANHQPKTKFLKFRKDNPDNHKTLQISKFHP